MPPKGVHSTSSSKGAGARGKVVSDEVLHVSIHELNSADTFSWIHHEVSALRNFENSWRLTGAQLIGFSPVGFIPNLQAELPMLPRSTCIEIFVALQNKIIQEVSSSGQDGTPAEPSAAFNAWINAQVPSMLVDAPIQQQQFPVNPINLSNIFSPGMPTFGGSTSYPSQKAKFTFGSPATHSGRFKQQPPSLLAQYPALSLNLNHQQFGFLPPMPPPLGAAGSAMLHSTASVVPPVAAGSAMLHSAAGVAPQPHGSAASAMFHSAGGVDPNSTAARAAMLHSAPGVVTLQSVLRQAMSNPAAGVTMNSPLSPEDQSQLQLILSSPQLAPLFLKFAGPALATPVKPVMPWVVAAQERGPMIQDENMPLGYKRINVHQIIKAAVEERKQTPALVDTSKAVKWPVMNSFDEQDFEETRLKYYECVLSAVPSAMFATFKSCLSTVARNTACSLFSLDIKAWISLADDTFLTWCSLHFGPENKAEAERRLKEVRIDHSDLTDSQSTFLTKFDTACYKHEFIVNDIANSSIHWSTDTSSIDTSALTDKEVAKAWMHVFPSQEYRVFSVQLKKCREYIQANQTEPFNLQVLKLRKHFEDKDKAVFRKRDVYTTQPTQRRRAADRRDPDSYNPKYGVQSDVMRKPFVPYKRGRDKSNDVQASALRDDRKSSPKKVVPGHMRGLSCGSTNNHFGLGCTITSCPFFKTSHDKSARGPYVWKSSDVEPSVSIPPKEYAELMRARPEIADNWKKARGEDTRRRPRPSVAALAVENQLDSEEEHYDQRDLDADFDRTSSASDSDHDSDEVNTRHYVLDVNSTHVAAATSKRRATSDNSFEDLGHMEQFFGVTRFAKNDEFVIKTLLDPGATINIMCPTVANRSQLQRKQLAVNIFQGNRKQASVEEMVECKFELMNAHGKWSEYVDWFAVCDLGYDVLLGRRFCRDQQFTNFDDVLMEFDKRPVTSHLNQAEPEFHVAALATVKQCARLRFQRIATPAGKATYKRKAKCVQAVLNGDSCSVGSHVLHSQCELSNLLILEERFADGKNSVKLSFGVDLPGKQRSASLTYWFDVHVDKSRDLTVSKEFLDWLRTNGNMPEVKSFDVIVQDVKPVKQPDRVISDDEAAAKKQRIIEQSKNTKRLNDLRFASYHPVQRYRLKRAPEAPLSVHWKRDHLNHLANKDYRGERAAIVAAYELATVAHDCRRQQRVLRDMHHKLATSGDGRGLSPNINCWFDSIIVEKECVVAALSDKTDQVSTDVPASLFQVREYVEICNAVRQVHLNGQRVRLCDQLDGNKWVVSLLGKGGSHMICAEQLFKKLPMIEQQRSIPAGANISFEAVGIDESGQPNVELKNVAHRQFGKEHSAELTKRIAELKAKFPQVFTEDVTEPCDFEPMKIKLIPNAVLPSKARFYRNTPKMREEVRRQIQEQLLWGAIRKCETPCVSDVLLVKRPHMPGRFRFVVNYIKLNDATVKEQLLMPDPKSQYERLNGCKIFGAIDFSGYYRQLRLHEDSQYLTGFASDEGTFCYTRVPMGITGACQWAQKVLQEKLAADPVLGPLGFRNYFDDLPFGAKTEDEFMEVMEAILNFCAKWKLKVNPEKSVFGVNSITHVGFVVSEHGVQIDPERNKDIAELTSPKSIKKVQSVLGIMNYVRNFVPNFSSKAKFLTDKLAAVVKQSSSLPVKRSVAAALSVKQASGTKAMKSVPKFTWSEDDERQFVELKQAVLNAPMLVQLNYDKPIFIRCDASRFGAGAVLFQYDDRGFEFPVCYASRKFLPAERNWSTFSQEASTVVWALERFAEYTQGYHVIVECDHRNISYVKRSAMPQLARWRLRLQDMDFSIRFLAGCRNETADGLSRQHVDDEDVVQASFQDVIPECALPDIADSDVSRMAEISALTAVRIAPLTSRQRQQSRVSEQSAVVQSSVDPLDDVIRAEAYEHDSDSDDSSDTASGDEDVIDLTAFGPNGEVLDEQRQPQIVEERQPYHLSLPVLDAATEISAVHNDLSGHAGTYVTLQRVLKNSRIWGTRKQMLADIDAYIAGCPCCQKMRKRASKHSAVRHVISGSPFAELSIDILKLPTADAFGYSYVCVIVDSFSHWTSLIAIKNKSAFDAARALMQTIGNFGAPVRIRSDGGSEFVNGVIAGLQRMLGVSHHVVVPYTPTANGIVERANRAILERLREMVFSKRLVRHPQHVWSDLLPLAQRALNASLHSAIGTSPARILFGDNLDLDRCLLTAMPHGRVLDVSLYVDALSYNQRIILEDADKFQAAVVSKVIAKSEQQQRRKNAQGIAVDLPRKQFAVDQWVLVKPSESYPLHKLAPRWLGPFQVHECSEESEVVVVRDTLKNKLRSFLKRKLELFDVTQLSEVEGLRQVAESDAFEFPVESICGHALIEAGGVGASPLQLPASFKRGVRPRKQFQFLIKWSGYEEPSWVEYNTARRLVQFPGYVSMLPLLNML